MGAVFIEARLLYASLPNANLREANFSNAQFLGADLRNADLQGATFQGASLKFVDLTGSNIDRADFGGADPQGAILESLKNLRMDQFAGTYLSGSTLLPDKPVSMGSPDKGVPDSPTLDAERGAQPGMQGKLDSEEFRRFREWIDARLHPFDSQVDGLLRPLTTDAKVLLDAILSMERRLGGKRRSLHQRILNERRLEIMRISINGQIISARKLRWELLPLGELEPHKLRAHLMNDKRIFSKIHVDFSRIEKILSLNPSQIYVGKHEFAGYIVFIWGPGSVAVLDHPVVGNALYVLKDDWQSLSHLTKTELLENKSKEAARIIHNSKWFDRLRHTLSL